MATCVQFWIEKPLVLVEQASEFFPFTENDQRCTAAALNSLTRFGLYLGALLAVVRFEPMWLLVGVVFAVFSVGAWFFMEARGAVREGFDGVGVGVGESDSQQQQPFERLTAAPILDPRSVNGGYVPDVIGMNPSNRTYPSAANPFMNVMVTEIGDNPFRYPAANIQEPAVKHELDSYFSTLFANDPGDVFNHTQSQRMWVTMPSTTVPNDQSAFADWLYRVPGQTCKEGNLEACYFNTGAEALPWREMRKLT